MKNLVAAAAAALVLALGAAAFVFGGTKTVTVTAPSGLETICVSNFAPQYISNRQIQDAIPAWQHALNVDFAGYWHTARYRFVFLGAHKAKPGCISAEFQAKGPVKGALAYHWTERGDQPSITVYAGTGDYYGFDNNVSMTHELFEMAADPVTSYVNQGYPYDYYWLENKALAVKTEYNVGLGWFNEVSDPVEADSYCVNGADGRCVKVSDFVTPAWFNDGVGSRYDYLGLCQQPFWIRPGGYAQYLTSDGWQIVTNFRTGHPADAGFSKSDPNPS